MAHASFCVILFVPGSLTVGEKHRPAVRVFLLLVDMSGYQLMMLAPVKQMYPKDGPLLILFSTDFCIYLFS